jgi:hypothetical protein
MSKFLPNPDGTLCLAADDLPVTAENCGESFLGLNFALAGDYFAPRCWKVVSDSITQQDSAKVTWNSSDTLNTTQWTLPELNELIDRGIRLGNVSVDDAPGFASFDKQTIGHRLWIKDTSVYWDDGQFHLECIWFADPGAVIFYGHNITSELPNTLEPLVFENLLTGAMAGNHFGDYFNGFPTASGFAHPLRGSDAGAYRIAAYGGTLTFSRDLCPCLCAFVNASVAGAAVLTVTIDGVDYLLAFFGHRSPWAIAFVAVVNDTETDANRAVWADIRMEKFSGVCKHVLRVVHKVQGEASTCYLTFTAEATGDYATMWPTDPELWTLVETIGTCSGAVTGGSDNVGACAPCDCPNFFASTISVTDASSVTRTYNPCWYRITGLLSESCQYLATGNDFFGFIECYKNAGVDTYRKTFITPENGGTVIFEQVRDGCMTASWTATSGTGTVDRFVETESCSTCTATTHNTGAESSGSPAVDSNWTVDGGSAYVSTPYASWVTPPAGSLWISADPDSDSGAATTHTYSTTITLEPTTRLDAISIPFQVSVDNRIVDIRINGHSTGIELPTGANGFLEVYDRVLPYGYWVAGDNTIEIDTTDDGIAEGLALAWGTPSCVPLEVLFIATECPKEYTFTLSGTESFESDPSPVSHDGTATVRRTDIEGRWEGTIETALETGTVVIEPEYDGSGILTYKTTVDFPSGQYIFRGDLFGCPSDSGFGLETNTVDSSTPAAGVS